MDAKTSYDRVMEKHQEKKQMAKERKEERIESGIINKLVIIIEDVMQLLLYMM